jgi:hypothetical protein
MKLSSVASSTKMMVLPDLAVDANIPCQLFDSRCALQHVDQNPPCRRDSDEPHKVPLRLEHLRHAQHTRGTIDFPSQPRESPSRMHKMFGPTQYSKSSDVCVAEDEDRVHTTVALFCKEKRSCKLARLPRHKEVHKIGVDESNFLTE